MSSRRLGCYYCFKTLDSQDKKFERQTFIECSQCRATYHSICWDQMTQCLRCGYQQIHSIEVPLPSPLQVTQRASAILIKPSEIIYLNQSKGSPKSTILRVVGGIMIVALVLWTLANFVSRNTNVKNVVTATTGEKIKSTPIPTLFTPARTPVPTRTPASMSGPATAALAPKIAALCDEVYLAQPGDSMSKIANRLLGDLLAFDVIVKATIKAHALDPTFVRLNNPDELEVGDKLCVPFPSSVVPSTITSNQTNTATPKAQPETTAVFKPQPVVLCSTEPRGEFANLWKTYKDQMGCPLEREPLYGKIAEMPFERGHLFWLGNIDKYGEIRLIIATFGGQNEGETGNWLTHLENWNGEGICGGIPSPPEGLYLPDRGLAKGWCEIDGINKLGYALTPKELVPDQGISAVQNFAQAVIFRDSDGYSKGLAYVLFRETGTYIRRRY
jgi:hypothetical protein